MAAPSAPPVAPPAAAPEPAPHQDAKLLSEITGKPRALSKTVTTKNDPAAAIKTLGAIQKADVSKLKHVAKPAAGGVSAATKAEFVAEKKELQGLIAKEQKAGPAGPIDAKDMAAFKKLNQMPYAAQAKWYLNGFWSEGAEKVAEDVFKWTMKFTELDTKKKAQGSSLDEIDAHKFLESLGETHTVLELRAKLRRIDVDADGRMALLEYFAFRFNKTISAIVNNPQGGDEKDQAALNAAADQLDKLMQSLAKQEELLAAQRKAEAEVKKAEADAKAAVDDLNAKVAEHKKQMADLEAKIADPKTAIVARGTATQRLAELKAKDPLPINRAKLTAEAAHRRVEKERKAAEAATKKVEDGKIAIEKEVEAAQKTLDELKKRGGAQHGSMWWMQRELTEAKKYLPQSKGGIAKK